MNWSNVRLVFLREVRDQLRDRRTLFMIFVLPLLLYPSLGIGMAQMQLLFTEQPRTVVLLGIEHLPDVPDHPLLKGHHFSPDLFERPGDSQKITVLTDRTPPGDLDPRVERRRDEWFGLARKMAPRLPRLRELQDELEQIEKETARQVSQGQSPAEAAREKHASLSASLRELKKSLSGQLAQSDLQLVVVIPEGFGRNVLQASAALENGGTGEIGPAYPGPMVAFDNAVDKSQLTYRTVKEVFKTWETDFLKSQLKAARLPESLTEPVHAKGLNVALDEQESSSFWSKLLPALLVIMAMTGAFYPAVDLVAGEKERGTMETLLISPASRVDIVLGKFLTTLAFSCTTVVLNLSSMGLTGKHMISMMQNSPLASRAGDLTLPSGMQLMWTVILMIPLAALFSALCLALATLARSSKEGQYYLTPLLMVAMGMTVFCMAPGIDLSPKTAIYTVIPIANVALLLKGLLGPSGTSASLYYLVGPVLIASVIYAAAALWWAIDQFQREEVLFRDTDQFDLRLWLKHLMRDKEPTPTPSEAVFCFMLIMLLQFLAMPSLSRALEAADPAFQGLRMMQLIVVQQLAIIATVPLMMGIMLTTSVRRTFRLNWPPLRILAVAIVLPIALQPLLMELSSLIPWPELPQSVRAVDEQMRNTSHPVWLVVLVFALTPALCEELAFRGFMLSGFSRAGRVRVGILLSSFAFGLMHMIPQQVFNTTLVGFVLAILAVRSHSLLPGVVAHFVNNAMALLFARSINAARHPAVDWLVLRNGEGQFEHFSWPALGIAAAVAVPLLGWLVSRPAERLQAQAAQRLGSLAPRQPLALDA